MGDAEYRVREVPTLLENRFYVTLGEMVLKPFLATTQRRVSIAKLLRP